jgi:PhnB protein
VPIAASVIPQLSVQGGRAAIEFYKDAFGAVEQYRVGGTDAQRAIAAGAKEVYPVAEAHRWLLGRIEDPFGHQWEIGRPLGPWPPAGGRPGL